MTTIRFTEAELRFIALLVQHTQSPSGVSLQKKLRDAGIRPYGQ